MKKLRKNILIIAVTVGLGFAVLGFLRSFGVFAASTPSLGAAATYGILANTYTNSAAGTTVDGDVGFLVAPTVEPAPIGGHTNYGAGGPYVTAGANQATALAALNAEPCTFDWGAAAVDLFLDTTHGPAGVYIPGVYCTGGAMNITGSLTFNGSGTYIFRAGGALGTTAGIGIALVGGASACDVFWTPHATTFGAGTSFAGTLIDNDAVTVGAGTSIVGRILAFNGPVTTATTTINLPTCTPPPATLHVVKQVVNDSGSSETASSFNVHVKFLGADVAGSPAAGAAAPGTSYSLAAGTYVVSEDADAAYTQSFSGDCNSSGSVTLASGEDKTCTITNDDRPGSITVVKTVVNDNGGTKVASDFPLFVGGTPVTSGVSNNYLAPGSYNVSETADPNYTQTFSGDCDSSGNLSLNPGDSKTCTITNNDIPPILRVVKHVVNSSGGTANASNFNLHVKLSGTDVFGSPASGAETPGNSYSLNAGTYVVSEDVNAGYAQSFSGDCNSGGSVTLVVGDNKTCTITNTDIPPTLHIIKTVVNDNGGTMAVSDATIHVKSGSVDVTGSPQAGAGSPGTSYTLNTGTYSVSEDASAGYSTTFSGDCNLGGSVTLASGDAKTCTITNNDIAPTLRVVKQVVNNSGGVAVVSSFGLHVKSSGVDVAGSPMSGTASPGTPYSLSSGTYSVSEDAFAGYSATFSGDCNASGNITLALGADKTCIVTNDDIPATLRIIKTVTNDNGGTATAASFNMHVRLSGTDVVGSPASGASVPGTAYSLAAGTYAVSEDINTSYAQTFTGDCNSSGDITLALGNDKTCTITNNDIPATITVVNVVVNDNGQTKTVADFPLFVSGTPVTSGVTTTFSAPASHTVTKIADSNYIQTLSGDCDTNGNVSLNLGDAKVCTITNDDIGAPVIIPPVPPLIDVVKIPSPMTLPSGPGSVTYAYTLRNIGTVTATNIIITDDSCSTVAYASGDNNTNAQLEVSEAWTYVCTTTLSMTHTNNVVATGLANGITATDIASATAVVGSSAVPPLIHVTKVPSVPTLIAGGGMVTFTQKVTNPGVVPLSNVTLTDDDCRLTYMSGDTNNDSKLDPTETWTYSCQMNLTRTTTNAASVTGQANGLTARDFAFATVVVATAFPKFPNTGFGAEHQNVWNILIPASTTLTPSLLYLIRKRAAV